MASISCVSTEMHSACGVLRHVLRNRRQFDNYLSPIPSWLTATLRNGPVFTLIAAVVAFSVGLCILASQTAIQQVWYYYNFTESKNELSLKDHIATAIVSTVLAGVHAILLLLISAWFLWEQWRANHLEFWEVTKKTIFIPRLYEIKKHRDRPRNTLCNTKENISRLFSSVLGLRDRTRAPSSGSDINTDIEKGRPRCRTYRLILQTNLSNGKYRSCIRGAYHTSGRDGTSVVRFKQIWGRKTRCAK